MKNQESIRSLRIVIFGLGLMGGSLALALRGKCQKIEAIDADENIISYALQNKTVDYASTIIFKEVSLCDLIILATPVKSILTILEQLPDYHQGRPIVMDLGSTKREIATKMSALPERFDPIGGHPMCGKEKSSLFYADAYLYQDATFALTPLQRTTDRACSIAEQLVLTIGAKPLWIDPDTHDRWVAATSHVPYLISNALAYVLPEEAIPLVGPGFRGSSRLAGSSINVMKDIIETNRDNVLSSLRGVQNHLNLLENLLESNDFVQLFQMLDVGAQRYYSAISLDRESDK